MGQPKFLICNCEKTMPLNGKKLAKACAGVDPDTMHMSLCRAQLSSFEAALNSEDNLIVACTQEAPLFQEVHEESGSKAELNFVNIRENAGWSKEAEKSHAKIAALLADASYQSVPARLKSVQSDGLCLVYGSGQQSLEIAQALSSHLSVTLLLSSDDELFLPAQADIPIYRGTITQASGSFGAFEVTVDGYSPLRPSSRGGLEFGVSRNGAKSNCSLIFDVSGKTPLFSSHKHRDGYAYCDPDDPVSLFKKVVSFSEMVGEYEKPIYVDYNSDTCAHSRSQKTGCSKCLDVCPAGAIADAGDIVSINHGICGGCGSCHAVCPTGSIAYQYPNRSDVIGRVQNLLGTYTEAGGSNPELLLHGESHGTEMISAMARFGDGLPANTVPVGFHAITVLGHVELLGMACSGANRIVILVDPKNEDETSGLVAEVELANHILSQLNLAGEPGLIEIFSGADPDELGKTLWSSPKAGKLKASSFAPLGEKRDVARTVFSLLHHQSGKKSDVIELPDGAPYGCVGINAEACTLCMACTAACPANAITDTPGEPKLRFTESACVQCGLCVSTCPESALSLVPQLDFTPAAMQPVTLYEEEPFECISCGKPFATRSTIEHISNQLAGKHSMFSNSEQSDLIKMCEDCRIEAQANSSSDPFVVGDRPKPRTTEDYIAAENGTLTSDDFLIDK